MNQLNEWAIKRVPRIKNIQVNALARVADTLLVREAILLSIHLHPTFLITVTPVCSVREGRMKWTLKIENYLWTGYLPEDSEHAYKARMQAARFTLIGDCLYKRSFGGSYLRCLDSMKA